ncbi:MAG: hypothetical protein IPP47_21465 [Bryobacterales bacterium]|nr:hypothetical protein [Bryobacterales bacterium]
MILTGEVKTADDVKRYGEIAAPLGRSVVNMLRVSKPPAPRQIMLQVKFASIDRMHLSEVGKVSPSVSALDFSNAVTLQGFLIPALSTRTASTEVELKDGESFAIAGLLDSRVTNVLNKIPGWVTCQSSGQLFRSRSTKKSQDELLVVITPRFVKPLTADERAQLPASIEPFLESAEEALAAINAKKKKKGRKAPEYVGPSGYQTPSPRTGSSRINGASPSPRSRRTRNP